MYAVEIDPLNRLILRPRTRHGVPGPRRVRLQGNVALRGDHRLVYRIRVPDDPALDFHELELTGRWALTPQHELTLTLEDSRTVIGGNTLTLHSEPLAAEHDALLMAVTTEEAPGVRTTQLLRFGGSWQIDERNRLSFQVARAGGPPDVLRFGSAWEMGADHRIEYRYTRWNGLRRTRTAQSFVLRGSWRVTDHETLAYDLEGSDRSTLEIKATLASDRFAGEAGVMRFRLGVGERFSRAGARQLVFHGAWRVDARVGLRFELRYADGHRAALVGGVTYTLRGRAQLAVTLADEQGRGLGAEVVFTRRFPRGMQLFLRGTATRDERALEGGVRIPW